MGMVALSGGKGDSSLQSSSWWCPSSLQPTVIDSFEDLLAQTTQTDFAPLYADLAALPDHDTDSILPGDRVLTRGTQAYARHKEEEPL